MRLLLFFRFAENKKDFRTNAEICSLKSETKVGYKLRNTLSKRAYNALSLSLIHISKVLEADVVRFQNNKEKWVAFVGLLDGHPYETVSYTHLT